MTDVRVLKPVFVGYRRSRDQSGENRPGGSRTVEILASMLKRLGFDPWYDGDLAALLKAEDRVDWQSEIDRRLEASGAAIILWSEGAERSARLVHELALAYRLDKEVVVTLDGAVPEGQWETIEVLNFEDFDAFELGRHVPTLLRALARRCGLPARWTSVEQMIDAVADIDLPKFRLGNLEIPATVILGCPDETYGMHEVECRYREEVHHLRSTYPGLLREHYKYLLGEVFKAHELDPTQLRDNPLVRLDSIECLPEGPQDEKGHLLVSLSQTSYFQIWATNVAIDIPIPSAGLVHANTLRRLECVAPADLRRSVLANNPGVETMVVSDVGKPLHQRHIIIRRRKATVAGYRGWHQSSASGHFALAHCDTSGTPSPFVSAEREARQEIDYGLDMAPQDYRMFGLMLKHQDLHPTFFGFCHSAKTGIELVEAASRDSWEGKKSLLPLDADAIMRHIAEHKWFPLSAICLVYTGIHLLGRDAMEDAARRIRRVEAKHFHWGDLNRVAG